MNRPGIKRSMMAKQRSLDDDELDLEVEVEAEVESSGGAGGGSGGGGGEDGDEDFVDAASSVGAGESSGSTLQGKTRSNTTKYRQH